jgi:beta-ribofuranosylaminobenzene 5'-phosphate synthase
MEPRALPVNQPVPQSRAERQTLTQSPGPARIVRIEAPARLHMGFLDMGGTLGRRFGSIGVGLDEIHTRLIAETAPVLEVTGPDAERAQGCAERLSEQLGRRLTARIVIERAIPGHAGLGSGTQMALAVGTALARLHRLNLSPAELAANTGRGSRSGIGIAAFLDGGLVVDAGRGQLTQVPPVIARLPFPADWRFIVVLDHEHVGLHGQQEKEAFSALPTFPEQEAARLCHLLLMRGLPALMEGDIASFGSVISTLQAAVGDHFAPAQGGRFTSPIVSEAMAYLVGAGAVGAGQSSWGPTGFCLVDNPAKAESLRSQAEQAFAAHSRLQFLVGTPRKRGADISMNLV